VLIALGDGGAGYETLANLNLFVRAGWEEGWPASHTAWASVT
jgi:hypothetical protein